MLTVAGKMLRGALAAVCWFAAKVPIQFEARPIGHKLGHVEMGKKLLAGAPWGRIVDNIEKASGVSASRVMNTQMHVEMHRLGLCIHVTAFGEISELICG